MDGDDSQLVEHLGWVQRLALSLARDRDAADDLAQDVARVWLEKRPAHSDGPRGWLASVARKLALDRARSEVSRKARERSASGPEGESYEVVERGARQRRVVEAVMQLAEPYRSTILYRYLDGLDTFEVAERMKVPQATVRKRIERGLALLRERLDREFGSRSDAWAIALLEPGLRSAVLKGVGVMSMKWMAAAGALALFAGVAWYVRGSSTSDAAEAVDNTLATWSLEELNGEPVRLFIGSGSTVPALIPIPAELCAKGGTFDLHLVTGRTLVLTFLDRETKAPLPNLEFQFSSSIELERSKGRVSTRSNESLHRTDAQGKAVLTGAALMGYVSVTVDFAPHVRDVVMKDGGTIHSSMQHEPDWGSWFKAQQPARIEETILVSVPLGVACTSGQVPAWAIALAGDAQALRVIARETTNETPQGRGMPFLLTRDAQGHFELCANAPATLVVWLEKSASRERISAETQLVFAQPGAQDAITFRELEGKKVTLRFIHVPDHGELQAWTRGKDWSAAPVSMSCSGADFAREFTLTGDEQIQLSLRLGAGTSDKSGWTRQVKVDTEREITIDLGGCERVVRLDCPEVEWKHSDGAILLLNCDAGEASFEQSIVALTSFGQGVSYVHIPNGRWLYRYDGKDHSAIWGVVDVTTATSPGEELVLRPRLRLAPAEEFSPGVRFDEICGISLAQLPEKFRILSSKAPGERIAVPVDAKYVTLDLKK